MVYLTASERFRLVFGEFGLLHFFSPILPFQNPKVDEGYRRIITYNSDYVANGMLVSPSNYEQHANDEQLRLLDMQFDDSTP